MYKYEEQKSFVFTPDGMKMYNKIREKALALLDISGAFKMGNIFDAAGTGSTWEMMACVDFMVESDELKEVTGYDCPGQNRVFVRKRNI